MLEPQINNKGDNMNQQDVLNEIAWRVAKLREGHGHRDAIDALDTLWIYLYRRFDVRSRKPSGPVAWTLLTDYDEVIK